ncbi:hypothetical protein EVAR_78395_1 [Eumeta japonica]|uniref:Uncharacterized protein n=1 Tax=Eumeta variegata TaxID=151549 RepID=A0A4C1T713_EUMVA|nr:hypothetical protein EVAR_78395_1 [Eumeta japonica]
MGRDGRTETIYDRCVLLAAARPADDLVPRRARPDRAALAAAGTRCGRLRHFARLLSRIKTLGTCLQSTPSGRSWTSSSRRDRCLQSLVRPRTERPALPEPLVRSAHSGNHRRGDVQELARSSNVRHGGRDEPGGDPAGAMRAFAKYDCATLSQTRDPPACCIIFYTYCASSVALTPF